MHKQPDGILRKLAYIAGFGIGAAWIALGAIALVSAAQGFAYDRSDWGVGWGLIGILMLVAGSLAIGETWWHLHRVNPPDGAA